MPTPGEHKTVQARILAYAQEIGWTYVPRAEAERRRGFDPRRRTPAEQARGRRRRTSTTCSTRRCGSSIRSSREAEGALVGELRRLHADIAGNRDFLAYLRNQRKFFYDKDESRELNLVLIDYEPTPDERTSSR